MLPCLKKNVKQLFKKMLFRGIANEIFFYIVYAHLESVLLQNPYKLHVAFPNLGSHLHYHGPPCNFTNV